MHNHFYQSCHGKFTFRERDELRDAHLEVGRGNKTSPKCGHDISGGDFTVSDEFGTEPEPLDEHSHHHELGKAAREAPYPVEFVGSCSEKLEILIGAGGLEELSVEGFNGRNGCEGTVDKGGCCACLCAFMEEERGSKRLGEGLDESEEWDCGKYDKGEGPRTDEGEEKACEGCREVLDEVS